LNKVLRVVVGVLLVVGLTFGIGTQVFAANNTNVTQTINVGTLVTDIRNASRVPVANPTFALSATTFSFDCQTTTGSLGSDAQRIYVDNPGAANAGWTLTIAATGGATANWANGGATQAFDYNDPTSAGCTDGVDADSVGGQLTLNPNAGLLAADCTGCSTTDISKGASASFSQGATDSVTLLNAASTSDDAGRWYLTGVGLSQTIPAGQFNDSYSINLTVTTTAS